MKSILQPMSPHQNKLKILVMEIRKKEREIKRIKSEFDQLF